MNCLNCNKLIFGRKDRKFCSHLCGSKYWNKNNKEKCKESYKEFLKKNKEGYTLCASCHRQIHNNELKGGL